MTALPAAIERLLAEVEPDPVRRKQLREAVAAKIQRDLAEAAAAHITGHKRGCQCSECLRYWSAAIALAERYEA